MVLGLDMGAFTYGSETSTRGFGMGCGMWASTHIFRVLDAGTWGPQDAGWDTGPFGVINESRLERTSLGSSWLRHGDRDRILLFCGRGSGLN